MEEKFKVGDIVQLKSGGPIMTLRELTNAGREAVCNWFNEGAVQRAFFPLESLNKVDDINKQNTIFE